MDADKPIGFWVESSSIQDEDAPTSPSLQSIGEGEGDLAGVDVLGADELGAPMSAPVVEETR